MNMDTFGARLKLLNEEMAKFENNRSDAYIAGFYAAIIQRLACDRLEDFEYALKTIKYNPNKIQV
jgi:hypothetical protein